LTASGHLRRASLAAGAVLLAACGSAGGGSDLAPPSAAERDRDLAALAKEGAYVLVLDVASPRSLTLLSGGATLRSFPVRAVEVGDLRVAFRRTERAADWWAAVRRDGRLDPPREIEREVVRPPDPNDKAGEEPPEPSSIVPPTPEERIPAPAAYRIRFGGGLVVEIVRADAPAPGGGRREAWREAISGDGSSPRVRLTLEAADAAELYRSLPEGTAFVFAGSPEPSAG